LGGFRIDGAGREASVDGFSTTSDAYNLLLEIGGLKKNLQNF